MKYLLLALALITGSAQASLQSQPAPQVEITDEDCDTFKQVSHDAVLFRNDGTAVQVVKDTIVTNTLNETTEYKKLLPRMFSLVDKAYSDKTSTPDKESEDTYMKCMDHVYAGTDF